ncbi:MAG TPA: hypothetical protein VF503_20890 [Sphingobium sp.]|uniref:hypothetical protein n=1 Tax=Sphingobium sp. TaxID=1912891 RepID=UPI002ED0AFC5
MQLSPTAGLVAIALAAISSPALADIGGAWHVTGEISGRNFVVDCRFDPKGTQFGGQCISLSTGDDKVKAGKSYKLTKGAVSGDQILWTYQTTVLFMGVDINYAGTLKGDHINGTISAGGRKGNFSAIRK